MLGDDLRLDAGLDLGLNSADHSVFTVELMKPVTIEAKSRFAIREGNRTVGAGIVTRLLE